MTDHRHRWHTVKYSLHIQTVTAEKHQQQLPTCTYSFGFLNLPYKQQMALIEHHKRSVWRFAASAAPARVPHSTAFACPHPVPQADTDTLCPVLFFRINHPCFFFFSLLKSSLSPYFSEEGIGRRKSGCWAARVYTAAVPAQNGNWFLVPLHTLLHVWPRRRTQPNDCTVTQETHPGYLSLERNTSAKKGVYHSRSQKC